MLNSLMPSFFYEMTSKILQSQKEKSCLDNCISRMKFFINLTSGKTAYCFYILTRLWLKKCSKLKNACTENKIWRKYRKQLSNRHHITQNSNLDIFFCSPFSSRGLSIPCSSLSPRIFNSGLWLTAK